jgi:hypothetical protein
MPQSEQTLLDFIDYSRFCKWIFSHYSPIMPHGLELFECSVDWNVYLSADPVAEKTGIQAQ